MNPKPVFTGVAVALVTFFDEHGHVDLEATAKHAAHLAGRGVRAVVVAGSTGEASHLSMKERLQLLEAVKHARARRTCPVILGTGNLSAGVSVPEPHPPGGRARGRRGASSCRPTTATCASSTARSSTRPAPCRCSPTTGRRCRRPGITHRGPEGAQGRRPQGLHGRHRAAARDAGLLPPPDLHGQRVDRRLRRACSAAPAPSWPRPTSSRSCAATPSPASSRPRRTCCAPTAS